MVEVLLTHSNHLAHDPKQWRKMQPYPPLGTLYAATALRAAGIPVAVFDPMLVPPIAGFRKALDEAAPKLVVIYEDDFNFVTKMCLTHMRDLACEMASIARARGIPVIAHGSDATDHPTSYLARGVDFILNGEAEQTLVDLCTSLLRSEPPALLPGLIHHGHHPIATPPAQNPAWSRLPQPARDLIDMEPYRAAWSAAHGLFSTNVVASRGCPYRCNWCAKPISGSRFQQRPPHEVAEEMHQLKTLHGVQHIWFGDDIFAIDRHWLEAFADAIEALGTPLPFKIQSRADLLSEHTVASLQRAGCTEIWMGVESGSQKILDAMTKGLSLASVHTARRRLAEAGIRACFFLQFGYPGEGWSEICQTIDLIRDTQPDDIGVSVSYPLPGTLFFERVQQQLGSKRNWADSDDLCTMHTTAYQDVFYRALRQALHAEVARADISVLAHLWDEVQRLEPISRNTHVLDMTPSTFVPLADVFTEKRSA